MVQLPVRTSYQSPEVGSSISNCKTFSTCPKEQKCPDKEQQHNRLSICESTWRHKVATSVLQNLGFAEFALENNMHLKAAHILGALNIFADQLSRVRVQPTEWQMHKVVVQTLFQIRGTPLIDLFAPKENKQTPVFCSWIPHQDALAIDALSISWEGMFAYVYPPMCLISKVLQHMEKFRCQIILIAPKWPCRHWYPGLLKFLKACPRKLPLWPELLQQPKTMISHPNPEVFSLHAWLLSTEVSKRRAFLTSLEAHFSLLEVRYSMGLHW